MHYWLSNFFEPEFILPLMIFTIPIIAVTGGIIHGIVRSMGQQRLLELTQRERIAAIERGVDPGKLPPLPLSAHDDWGGPDSTMRRFQGLLIGGIVCVFVGAGVVVFLTIIVPDKPVWAAGLVPIFVGVGLLLSALIIRPRPTNGRGTPGSMNG